MSEAQETAAVPERVRRKPVQERSRRTVAAILDAAEAIVDADGVNAATTRMIADRAGIAYPSLYRFYSDREQILDELLERHTMAVDALALAGEQTWQIGSAVDLMYAEFDLHVEYYRAHPSAARLWLSGRLSETVIDFVHRRIQTLADRIYGRLVERGLLSPEVDARAVLVAAELADRAMVLAYRGRDSFDDELLAMGRFAVGAYVAAIAGTALDDQR